MDSAELRASYEAVPYGSRPILDSHPARVAAVAALHGLIPPPVARCRVLELGCAAGGNLIPMALGLPDSAFTGVDFAPTAIARGRRAIHDLGLSNISLEAMSIAGVDDAFGTFDYIVCHGVYSWVSPDIQSAILRICARNLAPNGIAFVSYNTYPGWYLRSIARDAIQFHDDPALSPDVRAANGRALIEGLAAAAALQDPIYANVLVQELGLLRAEETAHLLHEQLETTNEPLWFSEFMRRAQAAGLRYVAEAQCSNFGSLLAPDTRSAFRALSADVIRFEQLLDIARKRTFRQTLLCHRSLPAAEEPDPRRLFGLHLAGRIESVLGRSDDGNHGFRSAEGVQVTTNDRVAIAGLSCLHDAQPATLPFGELWQRVRARLGDERRPGDAPPPEDPVALATPLLECLLGRVVEALALPRSAVAEPGDRPRTTALARLQAATTDPVTNLAHVAVAMDPVDRFVLARLDGTRDRSALRIELGEALGSQAIECPPGLVAPEAGDVLDASLRRLGRAALLEA
ncbi:MAG TPA: class I SAM-dependent methyltransferase [Gemmatimonadaceae bacterium]|nr:class I SAM-dependent methyltransferase [Gemmatimonadaceae bacterium]